MLHIDAGYPLEAGSGYSLDCLTSLNINTGMIIPHNLIMSINLKRLKLYESSTFLSNLLRNILLLLLSIKLTLPVPYKETPKEESQ